MKKICNGHFMSPFNTEDKTCLLYKTDAADEI